MKRPNNEKIVEKSKYKLKYCDFFWKL